MGNTILSSIHPPSCFSRFDATAQSLRKRTYTKMRFPSGEETHLSTSPTPLSPLKYLFDNLSQFDHHERLRDTLREQVFTTIFRVILHPT